MRGFEIGIVERWASAVRYSGWEQEGVKHGFLGLPADFRNESIEDALATVCQRLGFEEIMLPDQVHGNGVVELCTPESVDSFLLKRRRSGLGSGSLPGDAILASTEELKAKGRFAIGLRTADCVPILLRARGLVGAIHAGWRGIKSGIVESTLSSIEHIWGLGGDLEAVIGPCAGWEQYEIGEEVVEVLPDEAVVRRDGEGRSFLSLGATCEVLLRKASGNRIAVRNCGICTVIDRRFHSYRRDGAGSGRNLGFIGVS